MKIIIDAPAVEVVSKCNPFTDSSHKLHTTVISCLDWLDYYLPTPLYTEKIVIKLVQWKIVRSFCHIKSWIWATLYCKTNKLAAVICQYSCFKGLALYTPYFFSVNLKVEREPLKLWMVKSQTSFCLDNNQSFILVKPQSELFILHRIQILLKHKQIISMMQLHTIIRRYKGALCELL